MDVVQPRSADDISVAWLNEVLASTVAGDGVITDFRIEPVGEAAGFLGDIVRIELTWDAPMGEPSSVIAKFPTLREANRETGKGLLAYEREIGFYQHFSMDCPLNPPSFFGGVDVTGQKEFLILIEDLKTHRFPSQLESLAHADAVKAVAGLAKMHAHFWQHPMLDEPDKIHAFKDWAPIYEPSIAAGWPLFQQDFSDLIPDAMFPMYEPGNRSAAAIFEYFSDVRPKTLIHGDARIENICFDSAGVPRMYDWQLAAAGPGAYDLMYFFANSIEPAQLQEIGAELVSTYYSELIERGVQGYTREDLDGDLQLASCLLFGFSSMVGNFLANGGETERAIVATTTPRYWGTCQFFNVGEIINDLDQRLTLDKPV